MNHMLQFSNGTNIYKLCFFVCLFCTVGYLQIVKECLLNC